MQGRELAPPAPSIFINLTDFAWQIEDCASAKSHLANLPSFTPKEIGSLV